MKHLRISLCLLVTLASIGQLQPAKIHTAATLGRYYKVRSLLKQGVSPNERDKNGDTPLHRTLAGLGDKKATAKLLIDSGADVNAKNNDGNTSLHYVSKNSMAKYLLEHKAKVNTKNNFGVTPLHVAVVRGKPFLVSTLISAGARVNSADNNDITPLHLATAISYLKSSSALTSPLDPAVTRAGVFNSIGHVLTIIGLSAAAGAVIGAAGAAGAIALEGAPSVGAAVTEGTTGAVAEMTAPAAAQLAEVSRKLSKLSADLIKQGQMLDAETARLATPDQPVGLLEQFAATAPREVPVSVQPVITTPPTEVTGIGAKTTRPIGRYIAIAAAAITGIAATIVLVDMAIRNRILSLLLNAGAKVNAQDKHGNTPLHILADGKLLRPGDRHGGVVMAKRLIWNGADSLIRNKAGQLPYDLAKKHHRFTLYGTLRPGAAKKRQSRKEKLEQLARGET